MKKRFGVFVLLVIWCLHAFAQIGQCKLFSAKMRKIEDDVGWIATESGDLSLKIYGTEVDDHDYVRHAGPVEVLNREGQVLCKADIDLLEQPFVFAEERYFYFLSGDAIDVSVQVMDLKTCKISWHSRSYYRDNSPVINYIDSTLLLSKKKVPIGPDCLPPKSFAIGK